MRIFIALLFESIKKNIIFDILQEVKFISSKGSFISKNNLHLTLVYIGETDGENLIKIKSILNDIKLNKFDYWTDKIGFFRKSNNQKIVYLGLKPSNEVTNLYIEITKKLNQLDYHFNQNIYTPHITLGRKVQLKQDELLQQIYCTPLKLTASSISIMESKRINDKLVYEPIYDISLE